MILFTEKKVWTFADLNPGDTFAIMGGIMGQLLDDGQSMIFNYFQCGIMFGDSQPVIPVQMHIIWDLAPVGEEYDSESTAVPFITVDGSRFGAILDDKRRLIWGTDGIPQICKEDLAVRPITMNCFCTPYTHYPK